MDSAIIYVRDYYEPGCTPLRDKGREVFARMELFRGLSATEALDRAEPRDGEIILNSYELL